MKNPHRRNRVENYVQRVTRGHERGRQGGGRERRGREGETD
jgi:hypothetical protein